MNPTANQYEVQGRDVARKLDLEIRCAYQGNQCPPWSGASANKSASDCPDCGGVHGDKYRVTIKRKGRTGPGAAIHFDFWASWSDCYVSYDDAWKMTPGKRIKAGLPYGIANASDDKTVKGARGALWYRRKHTPSEYDILSCVGSDLNNPIDADDVVRDFGDMLPSRAEAIASFARKLQAFFTAEERAILSEVQ